MRGFFGYAQGQNEREGQNERGARTAFFGISVIPSADEIIERNIQKIAENTQRDEQGLFPVRGSPHFN